MLKKFTVRNYKGFKDDITVDFSNYRDYKFNSHVIQNGLLTKSVIYGKNSSGKTNFGLALFDITLHLVDKQQSPHEYANYLNASSVETSASFEYVFLLENKEVIYRYKKRNANQLVFEELFIANERVFTYSYSAKRGDFENLGLVDAASLQIPIGDMNISVLRYIRNNSVQDKKSILSQLFSFVERMLWFRSLGENEYIGYTTGIDFIMASIVNNGRLADYEKFLNDMEIPVKLEYRKDVTGNGVIYAKFSDRYLNFWDIASNGTKALTLYYYWSQKFSDISFLFIDEFDAFYHTEISETILKKLTESKLNQAMVTTHNTALMSNNMLRPDCYFILTKNKLTPLPECTERELREGHNLEKMFRNGEFK